MDTGRRRSYRAGAPSPLLAIRYTHPSRADAAQRLQQASRAEAQQILDTIRLSGGVGVAQLRWGRESSAGKPFIWRHAWKAGPCTLQTRSAVVHLRLSAFGF